MAKANFFHYHRGEFVTVSLDVGEKAVFETGGQTEEGYSYITTEFSFDGQIVTKTTEFEGKDCDGRSSGTSVYYAGLGLLQAFRPSSGAPLIPIWERQER